MNYVFFNGEHIPSDQRAILVNSRAFHFGDGLFETIRAINGKALFVESHFKRTKDGLEKLRIDLPDDFTAQRLENEINSLLQKNEISNGGRVRITFSRKATGYYLPSGSELEYLIEAYPIEDNYFKLNEDGRIIDVFPDIKKDINKLSIYKTLNCSLFIMASFYAQDKNLNDALIQNHKGGIIEATSSNVFLVSNGVLYTPGLEEGCVAGITRMTVINIALENNIKVYECNLTPQNLLAADEIFLTNAISGVQWVSSYRTKRFFNNMSKRIIEELNRHVSETS